MTSLATAALEAPQIYKLLTGLIVPRPIALVASKAPDGTLNLAPFSFFTVASAMPPVLCIASGLRYGRDRKDTVANIEATGEFVINIVDEATADAMVVSSLDWPADVDEFAAAKLTPDWNLMAVRVPRVAEAPAAFECKHVRSVAFGTWVLLCGEVVAFHFRDGLVNEAMRVDFDRLSAVGRLAGIEYCRTHDRYAIDRAADTPELSRRSPNPRT